jgi:uncharacterized protein
MLMFLGYCFALVMGLTLGLIGAGGSILTVPILVYFLQVEPIVATGYSLLIVGCAALIGAWRYYARGLVNFKAAAIFMAPAMIVVLLTRAYVVPSLPDLFIMLMFATLMLLAGVFMLRPIPVSLAHDAPVVMTGARFAKLIGGSAGIGLLTGMVGAGGGFLIIPTLIGLFGLNVKEAVGTSLAIIAVNSLVGFNGDIARGIPLDWPLLGLFLLLTSIGMWMGTSIAKKIDARDLRKLFGWFVLVVGLAVLADNLFLSN